MRSNSKRIYRSRSRTRSRSNENKNRKNQKYEKLNNKLNHN